MTGVLSDLRIIECSAFVAAPLCGMSLAQMGAEVIRIDPVNGPLDRERWPVSDSGESLYWAGLNKGKKSLLMDLRSPEGQELATQLVIGGGERGGILVTNLGGRGWASYERLRTRRKDVILALLSGNPDGSAAVDYTVNCATGLPYINKGGTPQTPVNGVLPAWDIAAGLTLAMGILGAERHRKKTGEGQRVTLALSDVAFAMMGNLGFIAEAQINGKVRGADANYIYGSFGREFATRDGRLVMITALTSRHWKALCQAPGIAQPTAEIEKRRGVSLKNEGERYSARHEISELLAAWTESRTLEDVRAAFDAAGACWGHYQDYGQLASGDPRCSPANPVFREVDQPGVGRMTAPGTPLGFDTAERSAYIAPRSGEHTDQILADVLNLSAQKIGELHDRRIVAGPRS